MGGKQPQLTAESGLACGTQSAEPCIRRGDAFLSLKAKRTVPQDTGGPTCCLHVSWLSQGVSPKSTHTHPIILEWLPPPPPRPCWRKQPFPAPPPRLPPPMADPCVPSGVSWACALGCCCSCSGRGQPWGQPCPLPEHRDEARGWAGRGGQRGPGEGGQAGPVGTRGGREAISFPLGERGGFPGARPSCVHPHLLPVSAPPSEPHPKPRLAAQCPVPRGWGGSPRSGLGASLPAKAVSVLTNGRSWKFLRKNLFLAP